MLEFTTITPKSILSNLFNTSNEIPVNIYETENYYNLEFFLAGIAKDNIELTYDTNVLTIKINESLKEEINYLKEEYQHPYGTRQFTFLDVDFNKSETNFQDGKLLVKLRKVSVSSTNSIQIK